jgi:hypothetical protein
MGLGFLVTEMSQEFVLSAYVRIWVKSLGPLTFLVIFSRFLALNEPCVMVFHHHNLRSIYEKISFPPPSGIYSRPCFRR